MLRAVAVLLVIWRHTRYAPSANGFLNMLARAFNRGGWVGVDLFLVLSGFLISGLLFKECQATGGISFRRFFIRRGFKIYPPFYFLCWTGIVLGLEPDPSRIMADLLMVQNYCKGMWLHTWSVALEEHFYILLACLLIFLSKRGERGREFDTLPRTFLFLAIACLAMRIVSLKMQPFSTIRQLAPTHLRLDSLFFGVVISYYFHYERARYDRFVEKRGAFLFLGGVACLIPAFLWRIETTFFIPTLGLTLFYLGAGMVLMALLSHENFFKGKFWSLPVFIGVRSYSIYLWHVLTLYYCQKYIAFFPDARTYLTICLAAPLVVGTCLWWLVERPSLSLRQALFKNGFHLS